MRTKEENKIQEVEDKLDGITTMDRLLLMIGIYMGWNGDISHVYVSDESELGDFRLSDNDLEDLSDKLGFYVKSSNYLADVVKKMESRGTESQAALNTAPPKG